MATKFAVIIAIEKYQDGKFKKVDYAENDARQLSAILEKHGFAIDDQVLLINGDATKARIDSNLRRTVDRLTDGDVLYVYYAGHGFSDAGRNYITCYDTIWNDMDRTSLPLKSIISFLQESKSSRIALFIDACHSGIRSGDSDRGLLDDMNDEEIRQFFSKSEYCVCFSSCKESQKSYPSTTLQHGVWTHCVLRALSGEAPHAMDKGGIVTAVSLQRYLSKEVPLTIRATFTDTRSQTPMFYGSMTNDFLIADVQPLIELKRRKATPLARQIKRVLFRVENHGRVKSLSGFQKHHRIPDRATATTNSWIGSIAEQEIQGLMDETHKKLREHLGYKRKDIKITLSNGQGSLVTPDFTFEVGVELDPEDTSTVIWRKELINISSIEVLKSEGFEEVFGAAFDIIEFEFDQPLNLEDFIDEIERIGDVEKSLVVDYPADNSRCTFSIKDWAFEAVVTDAALKLEFKKRESPTQLLQGMIETQKFLVQKYDVKILPV